MPASASSSTSTTADREIILSRTFKAPRALVWQAWTVPEHFAQWMGPRGYTITVQNLDVRVGGVSRYVMHGPDGTDYMNVAEYTDVVPRERLAYKLGDAEPPDPHAFDVSVNFSGPDSATTVTMTMVFPSVEACEAVKSFGAVELGKTTLEKLGELLDRLSA
ncbi:MAG: hypothetical protein JWO05_217 [Gemmatimonadetes bacterium]|nr:hypothetical protein [Gemmatimonadota bacterium]